MGRFKSVMLILAFAFSSSAFADDVIIKVPARPAGHGFAARPAKEYHTGLRHRSIKDLAPTKQMTLTLADCVGMPAHFNLAEITEPKLGVSPFDGINDQGQAGTCWAHDLSHAMFSYNVVSGVSGEKTSRQELTACDTQNYGVDGGNLYADNGYQVTHGQGKESDFPYTSGSTGSNGSCKQISPIQKSPAYEMVPDGANKGRLAACALWKYHTAAWSTVSAGGNDWNGDVKTEFKSCSSGQTNHATATVGYDMTGAGTANSDFVFTVANSWGTDWGDSGFYHIKLGCDSFGEEVAFIPAVPQPPAPTCDGQPIGSVKDLACPAGQSGVHKQSCDSTGKWVDSMDTCVDPTPPKAPFPWHYVIYGVLGVLVAGLGYLAFRNRK